LAEVGGGGHPRQVIPQRLTFLVEIEGRGLAPVETQELGREGGDEGLADLGARRCDDADQGPLFRFRRRLMRTDMPACVVTPGRRRFLAVAPRHVVFASLKPEPGSQRAAPRQIRHRRAGGAVAWAALRFARRYPVA